MVIEFIRAGKYKENLTENLIENFIYLIKKFCLTRFSEEASDYITLNDCIFDIVKEQTLPLEFAKDKLITFHVPYDFEDTMKEPGVFLKFLQTSLCLKPDNYSPTAKNQNFLPDWQLISLVQEMMGYLLMGKTKDQAAFFLVGDGANGKSVLANVLRDMIGRDFCGAMTVQSLTTDKFKASHLIGKKVNISNEEESKFVKSDKFKAIITHEMIDAEWKFGKSFEFIPTTKFLFCSNMMPTFENLNYGLRRRIQIIPFYRIFENHEQDRDLPEKLREEMPQILGFALVGAGNLVANNFNFSQSEASERAKMEFEDEISASIRFIRENYDIDNDGFIANDELYSHFRSWCDKNGKKPCNAYSFGHEILHNIRGIKQKIATINCITCRGKNLSPKYQPEEITMENI